MNTKAKRILTALFTIALSPLGVKAQSISFVDTNRTLIDIEPQTTQTQIKPGWKIVDVQLKDKLTRYLWGAHAQHYIERGRPEFVVKTDTLLLSHLVMVQLREKREYRQMRKPHLHENDLTFVELKTFSISQYEDSEDTYIIRPTEDIQPGEYFFTWYGAATVGKMEDIVVWPFTIR